MFEYFDGDEEVGAGAWPPSIQIGAVDRAINGEIATGPSHAAEVGIELAHASADVDNEVVRLESVENELGVDGVVSAAAKFISAGALREILFPSALVDRAFGVRDYFFNHLGVI